MTGLPPWLSDLVATVLLWPFPGRHALASVSGAQEGEQAFDEFLPRPHLGKPVEISNRVFGRAVQTEHAIIKLAVFDPGSRIPAIGDDALPEGAVAVGFTGQIDGLVVEDAIGDFHVSSPCGLALAGYAELPGSERAGEGGAA